jgi:hypothetical protein
MVRDSDESRTLRFRLATEDDDLSLRALARATVVDDPVPTMICYPAGFLRAVSVLGSPVHVMVGARGPDVIVSAVRAIRPHFLNGVRRPGGYLGELRIHPDHRRRRVLAQGFEYLRELHRDERCAAYCTVINESNLTALEILTSGRASLPTYTDLGRVTVYSISAPADDEHDIRAREVRRAHDGMWEDVVARLNLNRLQMARAFDVEEFVIGRFPGLGSNDFYYTSAGGVITGVMALWDQRAVRAVAVASYPPLLDAVRRAARAGSGSAAITAMPRALPPPGEPLALGYACLISTATAADFRALLAQARRDLPARGLSSLLVSLHERDPRNAVLLEFRPTSASLRLFAVTFDGAPDLDDSIPYFDAAFI